MLQGTTQMACVTAAAKKSDVNLFLTIQTASCHLPHKTIIGLPVITCKSGISFPVIVDHFQWHGRLK